MSTMVNDYADMPLNTALQVGDVVTITGPGEHDVLAWEVVNVTALGEPIGEPKIGGLDGMYVNLGLLLERVDLTLTRIQRPVPALSTVNGDYILTMSDGSRELLALTSTGWLTSLGYSVTEPWLTARISEGATLTRVVPIDKAILPKCECQEAVTSITAIDNGELDK